MVRRNTSDLYAVGLGAILTLAIFMMDLAMPLGIAGGVPYIAPVLIASWASERRYILVFATVGSVLTGVGFVVSPEGGFLWMVITNRVLAVLAIWVAAALAYGRKGTERALRQRTESLGLLQTVAIAANETTDLEAVIKTCVDEVCTFTGWPVGHAYMPDEEDGEFLLPTGYWYLDDPEGYENLRRATSATRLAHGEGLPGRVLASRRPEWIIDIAKDMNFPRGQMARDLGVRAAFAFPIFIGRDAVAVLEFFSNRVAEPDAHILDIMSQIGIHLGRVIKRSRAEQTLRDSEEKFRNLIEGSRQGFIIASRDRKILFCNQAAADIYGYGSPDEVVAISDTFDLIAPHEHERVGEFRKCRLRGGDLPPVIEFEGVRKDGGSVHIQAVQRILLWEGEAAIQYAIIDISRQKRMEQQLGQAQKMEAVGQLTGGVAHDFNNLLAIIQGNTSLLDRKLGAKHEFEELTAPILRAAKRGAELTHRMLAFSRRQPLDVTAVDVNELLGNMLELLRRSLAEEIEIEFAPGAGLWSCLVDPGQLEQTVLNLAINARDAMPDGGRLVIESANVTLSTDDETRHVEAASGDYVMVKVADSGVGIPAEQLDRIFEPFFTTKDVGKGTGLGLSMIYGFVKQSGGDVAVDSEIGVGTTFRLYLPRAVESIRVLDDTAMEAAVSPARGETILLVEDDADVRAMTVMTLRHLGYQVLVADDGHTGLALLSNNAGVDMLLTDVLLPGGFNGQQLASAAWTERPSLKVLFMSGYARDAIVEQGRLGADVPLLAKPFDPTELARRVREVLDADCRQPN